MIPMVDLKAQYSSLKPELDKKILATLANGQYILGPEVTALEQELAHYLGVEYAIAVASGTDALILALRAAGIGHGDEVITSPFTFMATASAICAVGAKPVFVDIEADSFNINISQIEAAITPKTKAIIPVHLYGQPADMPALQALNKKYQLKIIEDCAQSIGAAINGNMTGSIGDFGAFSFYPSKNLGCYGDGGLVTTNKQSYADSLVMLRNHGSKVRYHHDLLGYNSRLDEFQAAILRLKLPHLPEYNQKRREVALRYNELLAKLPITIPKEDGIGNHVYHQYTLLSPQRDAISQALQAQQIASAIYYPIPLHKQPVFAKDWQGKSFPVTEHVASQCLSLPIYPEMTDAQIQSVCKVIAEVVVG